MASTQAQDRVATLPLSPEQLAVAEAADGAGSAYRVCLVETGEPLDAGRFTNALNAAAQSHELMQYRPARVEGYRTPRLRFAGEGVAAAREAAALATGTTGDAALAASAWGCVLDAAGPAVDETERSPVVVASAGQRQVALAFDPLLLDEGSMRVLVGQALASLRGEAPEAPDFQYLQYIDWRRELERSDGAKAGQTYWAEYLGEEPVWLAPSLSYRESEASASRLGVRAVRRIAEQQAATLADLARQHETSVEVVLQAVWWLLIARLTGAEKSLVGWRHDCRADYEVMAGSVGVFEKTLPVLVDVRPDETVAQWLARFAAVAAGHVEQQEYWTLVGSSVTVHQVIGFTAQPGLEDERASAWQVQSVSDGNPGFELALHVAPVGASIEWSVVADSGRYPAQAAERLAQQFAVLLSGALRNPHELVRDLDPVGDEERALLLGINPVARDFGGEGILQRIARWGQQTPEAPALEGGSERISYRDLLAVVRRKAHWLRSLGVERGSIVAIALPRSVELVTTLLAVWEAGGGYLPLEPDWPALRQRTVLEDARPVVVVHGMLAGVEGGAPWRDVAVDEAGWQSHPDAPLADGGPGPEDVAYVLYTSGSTGKPKGVVIEHAQLHNYVAAVSEALQLHKSRRWALVSSVAADLGNTALFGALFNGACLVVAGADEVGDAQAFSRFAAARQIDAIKIVPSHLEALLECEDARLPDKIVLGGEAAPRSLLERIRAVNAQSIIHNHYGPTETTIGVMVHGVDAVGALPSTLPLTRVLGNNRVYVLDDAMRLVPAGARGEVYVGGAQLCRGYLNREGGADFVADPFEPGQRLYRTRDLAYVLPQGGIRLAGRSDEQVKVRGLRVSPAEVEAVLLTLPGVRQAVVLPLADGHASLDLGAFVVGGADPQMLKVRLYAELPGHMVPARIMQLDELPRLPNGKVDRQSLRHQAAGRGAAGAEPPKDPLAYGIAKSMAELLERDVLGPDEDFFELGAHSLLVIKLVARLRKQFGVEIAPAAVFDNATPATLAAVMRDLMGEATPAKAGAAVTEPAAERG